MTDPKDLDFGKVNLKDDFEMTSGAVVELEDGKHIPIGAYSIESDSPGDLKLVLEIPIHPEFTHIEIGGTPTD